MGPEHEAAVSLSCGEEDLAFEDEVGVFFLGDEEEFLVGGEMEFAVDDFDLAPFIRIGPTGGRLAAGEGSEAIFVLCQQGEGQSEPGEENCVQLHLSLFWGGDRRLAINLACQEWNRMNIGDDRFTPLQRSGLDFLEE